jgi:hypothetical protein
MRSLFRVLGIFNFVLLPPSSYTYWAHFHLSLEMACDFFLKFRQFLRIYNSMPPDGSTRSLKWRIFSQTSTEQSGKNNNAINFLPKSCPELSNQVLSFSACQICYWSRVHVRQSLFNFSTSDGQVF